MTAAMPSILLRSVSVNLAVLRGLSGRANAQIEDWFKAMPPAEGGCGLLISQV